jgi:tetratricopeptide (TPR) repeat protein
VHGALVDFSHAIRLDPKFAAAYSSRAAIESTKQDFDNAIKDYTSAIELNPQDVNSYMARANIETARRDFKHALDDYDKVIELTPDNRAAYRSRINIMEIQNDLTGAVTERVRMIEESATPFIGALTTNEQFFSNRGPGRRRESFSMQLDRALGANTNFAWGYYYRGVIKSATNDKEGALADFEECRNFPDGKLKDYAAIHVWLTWMQAGKKEKAEQTLQSYCQTRTNGTPGDWQMCIAKFLLNQISEEDFSKAIDSSDAGKQRSEFWYYTGMKHLLAGDKTGASDRFQKSLITKKRNYAAYLSALMEWRTLAE